MARFPHVHARSLEGRALLLPDELPDVLSCIVVAFRREHQELVDSWVPKLEAIVAARDGFQYYEMPTISRRWAPARRFIDGGMAMAITDQATRARTLTVYASLEPIVAGLGLSGTDDIEVVLVDAGGEIRWQRTGPYTEAAGEQLERAVAQAAAS